MSHRSFWPAALLGGSALVLGAAYVYGGWIPRHWAYLAPLAAVGLCGSLAYGVRRSGSTRVSRRLAAGFAWALAFAALLAAPPTARFARLYAAACRVEGPPGGQLVRRAVSIVVRYDGRPEFRVVFDSPDPLQDVSEPYHERMKAAGWQFVRPERKRLDLSAGPVRDLTWWLSPEPTPDLMVTRPSRGASRSTWWCERGADRLRVQARRVEGFHFRWGEGVRFFVDGPLQPTNPPDVPSPWP
jgi:hypothetical protein